MTELETLVAALEVEFKQPICLKQEITVHIALLEVGELSLSMEYELKNNETVAATASNVQVLYDLDTETTILIPSE